MGAIRYQTSGYSIDGIRYRISIFDKSYSGSIVSDFELDADFFTLRYDSGADENYSPIIGSELTLNIQLFKNGARNDSTLFTFLKSMIFQNTQTYFIIIEEEVESLWENYWRGNVVQDQSTWANDALEGGKVFTVTANDFAFLNELPFEVVAATPTEYNLRVMCDLAFIKLGLWDDYTGDITYGFLHNIKWFETTIPLIDRATTDMLYTLLTYDSNFTELNEDQTENTIKWIEILKTICIIFGCRLIQSKGAFWAIQMSNYANTTVKFYQRGIDLSVPTTPTISPRVAVDNTSGPLTILEGGSYTAVRPFYTVFVEKPRLNSLLVPGNRKDLDNSNHMTSNNKSALFTGGNNNKLQISFDTESDYTGDIFIDDATYGKVRIFPSFFTLTQQKFIIKIKTVGGTWYYLQLVSGTFSWTTTSSIVALTFPLVGLAFNGALKGTLLTPVLPAFVFNEVYVENWSYFEGVYPITSPGVPIAGDAWFKGIVDVLFLENGVEGDVTTYRASISPIPFDPTEKQIDTVYLYDNSTGSAKGIMNVNYGANPATSTWSIGTLGGSTYNLLEIAVLNALAQNRAVKEIITATIKGNYYPHQLLTYDAKQWHIKQATYTAGNNQWNGEWWELQYDETDITTVSNTSTGTWTDTALEG